MQKVSHLLRVVQYTYVHAHTDSKVRMTVQKVVLGNSFKAKLLCDV